MHLKAVKDLQAHMRRDKHQCMCGGAESWCRWVCQEARVRQGEANGPRPFSHFISLSASAPSQRRAGRRSSDGPVRKKKKKINKQRLESEGEERKDKLGEGKRKTERVKM